MKKYVVVGLVAVALLLAGCAETLKLVPESVTVAGQQKNYVFATGRDINGGSFNVMDRYDDSGKLIARDGAMNPGILPALLHGAVAGAEMGAGIGAGLAAQGAATVTQNGGGASSNAAGGTATATQVQGQLQGQAQGQLQGQLQNQGQSTGAFSPVF